MKKSKTKDKVRYMERLSTLWQLEVTKSQGNLIEDWCRRGFIILWFFLKQNRTVNHNYNAAFV